jgi:hypothetical protein
MRLYATIGALAGWFALALQLYLMLVKVPGQGMAVVRTVATFFSFFTVLTNLLVALVLTSIAMRPAGAGFFRRPSVQAGAVVYIAIVGISYHRLLRQLWNPQGGQLVADILLHSVMPAAYLLYWFFYGPRTGLQWKDAVAWLVYPGVYLVYSLARGAAIGVYPYPFVDVNLLGYGGVFLRAAIFLIAFLGMGLLIVAVGRWTRGRVPAWSDPTNVTLLGLPAWLEWCDQS